ncbi:MAG: hypothetical protein K0R92_2707 [Lachnospiraceae bacterium]|jgi:hypothetical protein|nr:hypothetical protein [Lachnospiraceae bacterium]
MAKIEQVGNISRYFKKIIMIGEMLCLRYVF